MTFVVYNDSYSPSAVVQDLHAILHLNAAGQKGSNDFDITVESTWNDYTRSLLPIPIICMSIGLLAVISFQIGACCACCCRKPNTEVMTHGNTTLRYLHIAFFLAFLVVLFYDQSIIFGNKYLSDGVSSADDGIDYVGNTFTLLDSYGEELMVGGVKVGEDFSASANVNSCDEANTLNSFLPDYFAAVDDYLSFVSDVPDKCTDAQDALHRYGVEHKNKTIWVFYGMFLVCLAVYTVGMCMSNKIVIYGGFCITDIVMFITFILCGVVMIILMLLGDFCMDPVENLLMIAPDSVYNVTAYYTTCAGSNPLDPSLQSAEELIAGAQQAVQAVLDNSCPDDVFLLDSLAEMDHIDSIFSNITALTACQPTQEQALSVLNNGLCDDTVKGIYTIWLGMFVCAAALFGASIIAALAYPEFPPAASSSSPSPPRSPVRPNHTYLEDSEDPRPTTISYESDNYARNVQFGGRSSASSTGASPTSSLHSQEPIVHATASSPVNHAPPVAMVVSAEPVDIKKR